MLRLEEEDIYAGIATSGGGGGDTPESAKGSFNASTQQLTLKYDYLVEKINSSTVVTDEQKSAMIALLNNQSLVIDMTSEPETMPENDYVYGFIMTAGGTGIGESYVDKQTPVTLKLAVTPDSPGIIGSYEAIAGFFTQMSGQPTTPEMVEAQYAPFIVDENLCTVSGTIGNFSVKFIEDGPVVEKYGATIGNFLGDVDSNGVLQVPSEAVDIVFSGVEDVGSLALIYAFGCGDNATRLKINSVQFPDLTTVTGNSALKNLCRYSSTMTSISFPKLKTITGGDALNGALYNCANLTSASFPELTTISGIQSLAQAFGQCAKLTSLSFPKLTTISGDYGMSSAMSYCTGLTSVDLSALETIMGSGAQYMFSNCKSLTSVSFPNLKKVANACLSYAFQGCTSLTSVSFPALTSKSFLTIPRAYSFNNMLRGVTGCTVHFPSNLESLIGSEVCVTDGFGGTNTTVLFDLPATE